MMKDALKMEATKTQYQLPEDLLQAVVGLLNEMPAGRVRQVLNAIELACVEQDRQRQQAAQQAQRQAWLREAAADGSADRPGSTLPENQP